MAKNTDPKNEPAAEQKTEDIATGKAGFEYPPFKGHIATVTKKEAGTYEAKSLGKIIRHGRVIKLTSQAQVDEFSTNGFLTVMENPEYSAHLHNRQKAQMEFLQSNQK